MNPLLTPRALATHALVLLLAAAFVGLGLWQLRRLEARRARNALVTERLAAPPEGLDALLARFDPTAPDASERSLAYRTATATGRWDVERELLLRSRSYRGQPGWHVLTPLLLDDGSRALLVDRGWVPYEDDEPPVADAAPPEGEVEVTGTLRPSQHPPTGGLSALAPHDPPASERDEPLDAVFWIDTERIAADLPYPLEPVYLELETQSPPPPLDLPVRPDPPELGEGSHLGYAVQWFSFALIAAGGYALLLRRGLRERDPPPA